MKQLILGFVTLAIVMVTAGPALAGGWAVATLDSVPAATAGETAEVGFTIRQHGVAPVNPDGEVGIVFRSADGEEHVFTAEAVGAVGHYVVEVTFPDEGTWTWAVRQGWFSEQPLGTLDLAPRTDLATGGGYRWPGWVRVGLPVAALLFGAGAIFDLTRDRRRVPAT